MNEKFVLPNNIQDLLIASSQGIESLTRHLADLLDHRVLVTTPAYEPISTSFAFPYNSYFQVMAHEQGIAKDILFLCRLSSQPFNTEAAGRAVAPVGRIIGYVFILLDQEENDLKAYKTIMDYAASLYAVHLQSRLEVKQEQLKAKNAFLYDLLYGNLKQREEIINMSDRWGWNFLLPHSVMLISLPDLEDISQNWHIVDVVAKVVERIYSGRYYKNPLDLLKRNELIIIVPLYTKSPADRKKEISAFADEIQIHLENNQLEHKVYYGVGQVYDEPADLFRSYQEAKVAAVMGGLLTINVPFFSDLGLERILYKHDLQDLREYYRHVLGELHKQDNSESSLISTLEAFADNQFDANKTAQATFIHRNTLRYRLNKIENILGKSLNEMDTRLNIVAALKIKRLHGLDELLNIDQILKT